MGIQIINKSFNISLYGFHGIAINNNYAETGLRLVNKLWAQIKANDLPNKGINVWAYGENGEIFTGVELETTPPAGANLELKHITLAKYASYTHIGPYNLIRQSCNKVLDELTSSGIRTNWPYLEIYGHWTSDESKLETELVWCLE